MIVISFIVWLIIKAIILTIEVIDVCVIAIVLIVIVILNLQCLFVIVLLFVMLVIVIAIEDCFVITLLAAILIYLSFGQARSLLVFEVLIVVGLEEAIVCGGRIGKA